MTGGGFGGCTINLVRAEAAEQFQHDLANAYAQKTGRMPEVYICLAAKGAGEWEL